MPDFLLPDLGEGLEEAEIISWRVQVGDHVDVDQVDRRGRDGQGRGRGPGPVRRRRGRDPRRARRCRRRRPAADHHHRATNQPPDSANPARSRRNPATGRRQHRRSQRECPHRLRHGRDSRGTPLRPPFGRAADRTGGRLPPRRPGTARGGLRARPRPARPGSGDLAPGAQDGPRRRPRPGQRHRHRTVRPGAPRRTSAGPWPSTPPHRQRTAAASPPLRRPGEKRIPLRGARRVGGGQADAAHAARSPRPPCGWTSTPPACSRRGMP